MKNFDGRACWGILTSVDLQECDGDIIRSGDKMRQFLKELVQRIDMRSFGEPIIVRFGDNPAVTGFSIVQLIETSCISGHFAENDNSAYIDVFSCKEFDPVVVNDFCKEFFRAKKSKYTTLFRGVSE